MARSSQDLELGGGSTDVGDVRRPPCAPSSGEVFLVQSEPRVVDPTRPGPYSFTAPVLVFMIRFWNTKNTTATGIVITAAAASLSGYCVPWLSAPDGELSHALGQREELRACCWPR